MKTATDRTLLARGYNMLFTAELILIAGGFGDAFNGELLILSMILISISAAGFFVSFKGIGICTQADARFKKAKNFALAGMAVDLASVLFVIIAPDSSRNAIIVASATSDLCELFVIYTVSTASESIFREVKNEALAKNAKTVRDLFLLCWAFSQILKLADESQVSSIPYVGIIAGAASIVFLIAGEIIYCLFLSKAKVQILPQAAQRK